LVVFFVLNTIINEHMAKTTKKGETNKEEVKEVTPTTSENVDKKEEKILTQINFLI